MVDLLDFNKKPTIPNYQDLTFEYLRVLFNQHPVLPQLSPSGNPEQSQQRVQNPSNVLRNNQLHRQTSEPGDGRPNLRPLARRGQDL